MGQNKDLVCYREKKSFRKDSDSYDKSPVLDL